MNEAVEIHNSPNSIGRINLLIEQNGRLLPSDVNIKGEFIAAHLWTDLLGKTNGSGKDFGIVVSSRGGQILTSTIFEGDDEIIDDISGKKTPSQIRFPFLPHGFKSLLPKTKDAVFVHTHVAKPPFDTTTFSAEDIQNYLDNKYNALVMIDSGGVHMLTGVDPYTDKQRINSHEIFESAIRKADENSKLLEEARVEMARQLKTHAIRYYYSPELKQDEDGFVSMKDVMSTNDETT